MSSLGGRFASVSKMLFGVYALIIMVITILTVITYYGLGGLRKGTAPRRGGLYLRECLPGAPLEPRVRGPVLRLASALQVLGLI